MVKVITDVINKFGEVTPAAIVDAAGPIMERSQELVPVFTGKLKRSAFLVEDTESRSGVVRVLMGYARFGRPHYAAFVHERTDIGHAKGKQAKFLETAVNEKLHIFTSRLIANMKSILGPT